MSKNILLNNSPVVDLKAYLHLVISSSTDIQYQISANSYSSF